MEAKKLPVAKVLKFAIPSLLGAALFLIPMKINGEFVLGVSILCDIIQGWMNPFRKDFQTRYHHESQDDAQSI